MTFAVIFVGLLLYYAAFRLCVAVLKVAEAIHFTNTILSDIARRRP